MDEKTIARFWAKVEKRGPVPWRYPELGPCWIWCASKDGDGYGHMTLCGVRRRAHRMAYVFAHGAIPASLHVCHRCDNPPCCNPAHLFLGRPKDNAFDRDRKQRSARGRMYPQAVLTEDAVRQIRNLRANGAKLVELSARFGVSQNTCCMVAQRKAWKHVE